MRVFDLASDLMLDNAMDKAPVKKRNESEWKPIFWPKDYVHEDHDHTLEGNTLSEAKMRKYGKLATSIRSQLRQRALALKALPEEITGSKDVEHYIKKLSIQIHKGYFHPHEKDKIKQNDFNEGTPIGCR